MQSVTLYLTVSVSPNTTSHPGKRDLVGAGEAIKPSMTQDSMISTRPTVAASSETPSSAKDHLPGEITTSMPPAADSSAGMPPAEKALRNADEAMTAINLSDTWEGTLGRIKWVMDTVSPVAEVRAMSFLPILDNAEFCSQLHPYAKMAYGLIFVIPKVICLGYRRVEILMFIWLLDPSRTVST